MQFNSYTFLCWNKKIMLCFILLELQYDSIFWHKVHISQLDVMIWCTHIFTIVDWITRICLSSLIKWSNVFLNQVRWRIVALARLLFIEATSSRRRRRRRRLQFNACGRPFDFSWATRCSSNCHASAWTAAHVLSGNIGATSRDRWHHHRR